MKAIIAMETITNSDFYLAWEELILQKVQALPSYSHALLLFTFPPLTILMLLSMTCISILYLRPEWFFKPTLNSSFKFTFILFLVSLCYAYSLYDFDTSRTYDKNQYLADMRRIENTYKTKLTAEQIQESEKLLQNCQINNKQQKCYVDYLNLDVLEKLIEINKQEN
ncbi:hypothetical protein [Snodgrassella communis]|uniref:Uncharacterized protein n=1 Tax=Snodgrassella alvi TaxID=1196083 RepID=A0A2N9XPC5_9NEIS|nr:hypothetical protein [Snodgrassella communis]PIT50180.1 hypothetical protein BHC48_07180 [Snodgrassella communis]